jgi:hypothetical protein
MNDGEVIYFKKINSIFGNQNLKSMKVFMGDYLNWIEEHPDGYVLNSEEDPATKNFFA